MVQVPERPLAESNLIVPAGTQIVTRVPTAATDGTERPRGAVGVVIESSAGASDSYRVRFLDGTETVLSRHDLAIRKHVQRQGLRRGKAATGEQEYRPYVIYRCVVGSTAYGLEEPGSDIDRRGIYLPPAELHWSIYGIPEQIEDDDTEECYWELEKFLNLALRANPNVLECLYTPMIEMATPLAQDLLAMRTIFLSQLVYQTYNGYVMSQFKKFEHDLGHGRSLKWKHVMHLIRLLLSGATVLREGFVPIRVDEHRQALLAIRRGQMSWEEINAWRLSLHHEFDRALASCLLPERPDYEQANAFLVRARRSMVPIQGVASASA